MSFLRKRIPHFEAADPLEAHQAGTPTLEMTGVYARYGSHTVLEDISIRLERGMRVAVVGPNGAGKSTLFKIIAGVLQPIAGKTRIYGRGPGRHICIAYLPQRSQVDWNFPVNLFDVVMMGRISKIGLLRQPGKKDRQIVQRCLEMVGLEDLVGRQISELSGGQQQRMFIARALAQEAELILMDEPLNGLDVTSQEIIFGILDQLRPQGVTVMVATHDLNLAADRFDRIMLLNKRLLGYGVADEVLTTPNLLAAYGGHLHMVQADGEVLALGDTCCDEEGQ